MSDEIKVSVVKFPDRANLMLKYIDPLTGKQKYKSAGTAIRKDASKAAGKWELELRAGVVQPSKVTWAEFREKYEDEVLTTLAAATDSKVQGIFNAVEKFINPKLLRDLDSNQLSVLQSKLKADGLADSTIKAHLAHVMAALRWAASVDMLVKLPKVKMPKRAKGLAMKGRPITGEEFDRLLLAVPKVLCTGQKIKVPRKLAERQAEQAAVVASWRHYLRGLWASGLRLSESLELCWDRDDRLCVDMQPGEHPMLRIPAELEKGNQDRLLPMAPEFAEFLMETPVDQRTGYVFNPAAKRVHGPRLGHVHVSKLICDIGEKAGIKVKTDADGAVKFASAHDLRRSFGLRWASRVMPQVLMELMRHESIDTTMRFYVGRNAQSTAAVLWQAHKAAGYSSGYTTTNGGQSSQAENTEKQGAL